MNGVETGREEEIKRSRGVICKEKQEHYVQGMIHTMGLQSSFLEEQSGPGPKTDADLYCPSLRSLQTSTTLLPLHIHWFSPLPQLSTINLILSN